MQSNKVLKCIIAFSRCCCIFNCSTGRTNLVGGHKCWMAEAPQPPTVNALGWLLCLKAWMGGRRRTHQQTGSHFGHHLGVHFRMSQLAGIHVLAKQKDNYASAWCEMCWWGKHICSRDPGQLLTSRLCYTFLKYFLGCLHCKALLFILILKQHRGPHEVSQYIKRGHSGNKLL